MLKNPFRGLTRREWCLWGLSCGALVLCNLLSGSIDPLTLLANLVGATFLIFLARGDVWGQLLTIVFSLLYGAISWRSRYWGEMITYLGMTMPMAALSVVSWLRHPFAEAEGEQHNEVEIHHLTLPQAGRMALITAAVTAFFGYILYRLDTPNLFWSTLSVTTSFLAAYLTFMRSSWYGLAFAANDLILIMLWLLDGKPPMAANFAVFFINDCNGFISWKRREVHQLAEKHRHG